MVTASGYFSRWLLPLVIFPGGYYLQEVTASRWLLSVWLLAPQLAASVGQQAEQLALQVPLHIEEERSSRQQAAVAA